MVHPAASTQDATQTSRLHVIAPRIPPLRGALHTCFQCTAQRVEFCWLHTVVDCMGEPAVRFAHETILCSLASTLRQRYPDLPAELLMAGSWFVPLDLAI